jgi:chromosome segregation ATPase
VKYWQISLPILATLAALFVRADDFETTNGKEYKNATVSRVEADGIVVKSKSGISKVYFVELPKEVQERFHYNPEKAAAAQAAAAQQAAEVNKHAEELDKQRNEASKQGLQRQRQWAEQQAKQQNIQALRGRLAELQQQEENLLAEIGRIENAQEVARRRWVASGLNQPNSTDPAEANLPLLRGRLENVRDEKERVRRELERAQRESQ